MLLAMDVGNTNIKIGVFDGDRLIVESRLATERHKLEDEYAVQLLDILRLYGVPDGRLTGAVISSVVPPLNRTVRHAVHKVCGVAPLMVGPGVKTGLNIRIDNPAQLGADLLVGAVAAAARFGTPCIIWNLGTATTLSVVDREGNFRGGGIMAGVGVAVQSLVSSASQLHHISLDAPGRVIGTSTIESMQSGAIYGTAAMLDGMTARVEEELGYPVEAVITGGFGKDIAAHCRREMHYDGALLLKGLHILYERNAAAPV